MAKKKSKPSIKARTIALKNQVEQLSNKADDMSKDAYEDKDGQTGLILSKIADDFMQISYRLDHVLHS